MFIYKRCIQAIGLSLLVLSSYLHAQGISLSLNESSIAAGDFVEISAAANHAELSASEADVYLAVQTPDGSLYYLSGFGLEFIREKNQIVPLVMAWSIQTLPTITLLAFEVPGDLTPGTYKWYLTLVKKDSKVEQPANWIANVSATLVLNGYPDRIEGPFEKDESEFSLTELEFLDADDSFISREETADFEGESSVVEDAIVSESKPSSPSSPLPPSIAMGEEAKAEPASLPSPSSTADGIAMEPPAPGGGASVDDIGDEIEATLPPFPDHNIPVSGTLTAGDIDDNLNLADFQRYLARAKNQALPKVEIADRVALHIVDDQGQGVSNARVQVKATGNTVPQIETYAGTNGWFYLFPQFDGVTSSNLELQLAPPEDELGSPDSVFSTTLNLNELGTERDLTITLPNTVATLPYSLDVMFVIDTTGSMSDELRYLITELRDIMGAVQAKHQQIRMRFGLVLYRDQGDDYVVRDFAFTESLNNMQIQLSEQKARGGGDYPEAMEQALETALNAQWRDGNVARVLFLVADAPPHDRNFDEMLTQVRVARHKGIRIYPLAASGVADEAEFLMRNAGVLTQGRYLFLTDDSGVGFSHQEPKISCYVVTRLDQLMTRVIAGELAGQRLEPAETDIIRAVGDYNTGICGEKQVSPNPSTSLAQVENIRILLLESFPLQVHVVANGYLRDGCEQIDTITSKREDNRFTVQITIQSSASIDETCTQAIEPFEEIIPLEVNGLKAGVYTVDVNGVTDQFKFETDNAIFR